MAVTDDTEKKFVMKRVLKDAKKLSIDDNNRAKMYGLVEKHFGVQWKLAVFYRLKFGRAICVYLDCLHDKNSHDWSIEAICDLHLKGHQVATMEYTFTQAKQRDLMCFTISDYDKFFSDGSVTVELLVTIKKMTGIDMKILKHFDDDEAKEHSDIVLKIGDQQFYVNKMYLASHSLYFKSLFSQNFAESQKSEFELKDIDAEHFQDFLELIYGVSLVEEYTISGILKMADYFDAPIALQRCEEFLMKYSKRSLAEKLELSIEYKMENLNLKCLEEMKNSDDVAIPEVSDFHENRA